MAVSVVFCINGLRKQSSVSLFLSYEGVRQDQTKFVPLVKKILGLYGSEWENQFHGTISQTSNVSAEAYLHGDRQVLGVVVTIATENWNFFLATLDAVNTSMHVGLVHNQHACDNLADVTGHEIQSFIIWNFEYGKDYSGPE